MSKIFKGILAFLLIKAILTEGDIKKYDINHKYTGGLKKYADFHLYF